MNPILQINSLTRSYQGPAGPVRALEGVSLQLAAGDFVAVRGPSGCGKTTLLLSAGGLLQPSAGEVIINGQNLYSQTPAQRATFRATHIGFVFQQFHLLPYLNVLQNILAPTVAHAPAGAEDRARELVARFGLEHRARHLPPELSTGERQRTALARALLNSPQLLLADEPTGNLDPENAKNVLQAFAEFARSGGAVLLVTHDSTAADFTHRTLRLESGRLVSG